MSDETHHVLHLDILNIPELISDLRRQMADELRAEADEETDPKFARKLRELAADFEVNAPKD